MNELSLMAVLSPESGDQESIEEHQPSSAIYIANLLSKRNFPKLVDGRSER